MDAMECLKTRRCVRSYKHGEIPREVIEDIVDCGRLAATAINIQPWHFIAITDRDMLGKIAAITDHGKFIADASCCIAVFCEKVKYYIEDGSAATQNLLLSARAHGLASCWVAGDKKDYCPQIAEVLNVPDNITLVSLITLGYSDSTPTPPKKSLKQVLHWEKF
ncbi:MAG: nitroreductase family protein [Armatimonadota bacterium]|nr:nitroreductase family protein [bacterium]